MSAKSVSAEQILSTFPDLVEAVAGPKDAVARQPCSSGQPQEHGLCFCNQAKDLNRCLQAGVSILIVSPKLLKSLPEATELTQTAVLQSEQLQLAMAQINTEFFLPQWGRTPFADDSKIHPSATVHATAELDPSVTVGPHTVIGPKVRIGKNTVIGANSTIEGNDIIGSDCYIMSNVYIGHSVEIGNQCRIQPQSAIGTDGYGYGTSRQGQHFAKPHFGKVILEDRVETGCGVYIDRGTFQDSVIGEGTKIDNYCHLAHNTVVGKNCLITAGLITAGSSSIGDQCVFAGRVIINGHISICDNTTLGPLSAVNNSITKPGVYGGFPPVPYKAFIKNQATTAHLAQMRKNVSKIMKKLGIDKQD